MKTCRFYLLNDYLAFFRYAGIELPAHFTLSRYTFSKCQQADVESRHD